MFFDVQYSTLVAQQSTDHLVHILSPNEEFRSSAELPQELEEPNPTAYGHSTYDGGVPIEFG